MTTPSRPKTPIRLARTRGRKQGPAIANRCDRLRLADANTREGLWRMARWYWQCWGMMLWKACCLAPLRDDSRKTLREACTGQLNCGRALAWGAFVLQGTAISAVDAWRRRRGLRRFMRAAMYASPSVSGIKTSPPQSSQGRPFWRCRAVVRTLTPLSFDHPCSY